mmetsp:Transcript_35587/g.41198  ORF Transcript_35587/g.41198 Transcript_35587/m.41198 type:complete len:213 (+) Transcript_35587:157-795(+)
MLIEQCRSCLHSNRREANMQQPRFKSLQIGIFETLPTALFQFILEQLDCRNTFTCLFGVLGLGYQDVERQCQDGADSPTEQTGADFLPGGKLPVGGTLEQHALEKVREVITGRPIKDAFGGKDIAALHERPYAFFGNNVCAYTEAQPRRLEHGHGFSKDGVGHDPGFQEQGRAQHVPLATSSDTAGQREQHLGMQDILLSQRFEVMQRHGVR